MDRGTNSDPSTGRTSGSVAFARALRVRRNAAAGFAVGVVFSLAVFVRFAYLPDRQFGLWYWGALALVLAVGTGILLTVALTVASAYRLARQL